MNRHLPQHTPHTYSAQAPVVVGQDVNGVPVILQQQGLLPAQFGHHCAVCNCDGRTPAPSRLPGGMSPGLAVAAGTVGVLVLGTVLVALLLSVAVVAAAVATCAVAGTGGLVVLRQLLNDGRRPRR